MFDSILRRCDLRATLLAALIASPAAAQFDVFSWTYDSPSGTGAGSVTAEKMVISGPETGFPQCPGSTNSFTAIAPYDLLLVADFSVDNNDKGGIDADYLVTIVDGKETKVSGQCYGCQVILQVPGGSNFGFGVHSFDCIAGNAVATLTNLVVEPAPEALVATGSELGAQFGSAVAAMDDINGDGAAEVAVGAPLALGAKGRVTVHSGSSLVVVRVLTGKVSGDHFGAALALAGDINGDGMHELLVGAPHSDAGGHDSGAALIVSSSTFLFLSTLPGAAAGDHFGTSVANAGDADGDGVDDLLIGAPLHDGTGADSGQAVLISGLTGAVLQTWSGAAAGDGFGSAVAGVGDVDGDGTPDVVVGSPKSDLSGTDTGTAQILSGATGAELHVLAYVACGGSFGGAFGSAVAGIGDVDRDGVPDVAVGAPTALCTTGSGSAWIFSGLDAHLLYSVKGKTVSSQFGIALAGAGDVDADGTPDLIVGSPTTNVSPPEIGRAEVLSGDDGALLLGAAGTFPADAFGRAVAAVGDTNGDGIIDLLIGSPANEVPGAPGSVQLLRPAFLWTDLGHALAGTAGPPKLHGQGLLAPGTPLTLTLGSTPPDLQATLVVGLDPLLAPFKGGVLVPAPDLLLPGLVTASPNLTLSDLLPSGVPPGLELFFQMWVVDAAGPKGLAASNALRAHVP